MKNNDTIEIPNDPILIKTILESLEKTRAEYIQALDKVNAALLQIQKGLGVVRDISEGLSKAEKGGIQKMDTLIRTQAEIEEKPIVLPSVPPQDRERIGVNPGHIPIDLSPQTVAANQAWAAIEEIKDIPLGHHPNVFIVRGAKDDKMIKYTVVSAQEGNYIKGEDDTNTEKFRTLLRSDHFEASKQVKQMVYNKKYAGHKVKIISVQPDSKLK